MTPSRPFISNQPRVGEDTVLITSLNKCEPALELQEVGLKVAIGKMSGEHAQAKNRNRSHCIPEQVVQMELCCEAIQQRL